MVIMTPEDGNLQRLATELLAAADDPSDVRVVTDGGQVAFAVPDALANKVKPLEEKKKPAARKGRAASADLTVVD